MPKQKSIITAKRPGRKCAGTRFFYSGGIEGWVNFGVACISRWFTWSQTVTHHRL